jgi:hypothetical protein
MLEWVQVFCEVVCDVTDCQFTIIRGGCGPNGTFLKGYRVMSLSNRYRQAIGKKVGE